MSHGVQVVGQRREDERAAALKRGKPTTFSNGIRQTHRWLSIAFTLGVIAYSVAMTKGQPPSWLGLFALLPLIALLFSGLYLFVLPYVTRWRGRASARSEG